MNLAPPRTMWRSTPAALLTWAMYRLDGRAMRSTSDFGGTGGGAPHERGAQITDSYDRVVEVERAVLATFEVRPAPLAGVDVAVCRRVFLALTVGKRLAKKIDPKRRGRNAEAAPGWKRDPGTALLLSVQDWRQAASDADLDEQLVALIVRVGLRQVTEQLAARGLVPQPRRKEERRMPAPKARRIEQSHLLSGWKEIGRYVGRDARTARRWARKGMPVGRDPHGWPIAVREEIDRWRRNENA